MKKTLSLLAQAFLLTSSGLTVVGCTNPLAGGSGENPRPPDPGEKDPSVYQKQILELLEEIIDCEKLLLEIETSDEYEDEKERQTDLDQTRAEAFDLKAQVAEAYYQILLLKVKNDFDEEQVLEGIVILRNKISNLEQSLVLKEKYPDDFDETEIAAIKNTISQAKLELEKLLKIREK